MMDEDLKQALDILEDALAEHEETWGREAFGDESDWAFRAATLLAKYERKN